MKFNLPWAIFGLLVLGVCSTSPPRTVTRTQLETAINSHWRESVNSVSYAGTQSSYHYFVHQLALYERIYRIPVTELHVENVFPYTRDRNAWRPFGWNLQPVGQRKALTITNLFPAITGIDTNTPAK